MLEIFLSITCACRSRSGSGLSRPGGLEDPLPNPLEWLGLSRPGGLEEPLPKWLGDSFSIKNIQLKCLKLLNQAIPRYLTNLVFEKEIFKQ